MSCLSNPADRAFLVTPSDSTIVPDAAGFSPRGLYVGTTGNITVVMLNDVGTQTTVLFTAVPVGVLPIRVRKVMSTGTTASTIIALG